MHEANLQSIIIRPFQLALVAFNQDWSRDFLLFPWYRLRLSAAPYCPLILSSASSVRDICLCVCVHAVYLHVTFWVASANFGISWIMQRESLAVRINDSRKFVNSFRVTENRCSCRGVWIPAGIQRDSICMRHTTRDRECECSK